MKNVIDLIFTELYEEVISNEEMSVLLKLKNGVIVEVYAYFDADFEQHVFGICDESGAGTETCDEDDLNDLIKTHWSK